MFNDHQWFLRPVQIICHLFSVAGCFQCEFCLYKTLSAIVFFHYVASAKLADSPWSAQACLHEPLYVRFSVLTPAGFYSLAIQAKAMEVVFLIILFTQLGLSLSEVDAWPLADDDESSFLASLHNITCQSLPSAACNISVLASTCQLSCGLTSCFCSAVAPAKCRYNGTVVNHGICRSDVVAAEHCTSTCSPCACADDNELLASTLQSRFGSCSHAEVLCTLDDASGHTLGFRQACRSTCRMTSTMNHVAISSTFPSLLPHTA